MCPIHEAPVQDAFSDTDFRAASTVPRIVMAEQITHDVVKQALSMGGPSPVDDPAITTNAFASAGETPSGTTSTKSKLSNDLSTIPTNAASTNTDQVDDAYASEKKSGGIATVSWIRYGVVR